MTKKIEDITPASVKAELAKETAPPRIRLLTKIYKLAQWIDANASELELDGNNTFQKFKYVKGAQYRTLLRKGTLECGLLFKQSDSAVVPLEGAGNSTVIMHAMQFLIDPDTGEFEQYVTAVMGQDGTDKHLEKAKTQGIKSFVKTNFLISDGDSDDNESDSAYSTAKTPAKKVTPVVAMATEEQGKELMEKINAVIEKTGDQEFAKLTVKKINDGTLKLNEFEAVLHRTNQTLEK